MKRTIFYTIVFNIFVLNTFADGALDVKRDTFGPCDRVYFSLIEFTQIPIQEKHYYTINDNGDRVMFAYGNLQYEDSTQTFRFAQRQWMVLGNGMVQRHSGTWIDLFTWGPKKLAGFYQWGLQQGIYGVYPCYLDTSFIHHENAQHDVVHHSTIAYDSSFYNRDTWRQLTSNELAYLLNVRKIEKNMETPWCYATIDYDSLDASKKRLGVLIFPDDFTCKATGLVKGIDIRYGDATGTLTVPYKTWYKLDSAGVTFLPCVGAYVKPTTTDVNTKLLYWLGTETNVTTAKAFSWEGKNSPHRPLADTTKTIGCAVRLVRDVKEDQ